MSEERGRPTLYTPEIAEEICTRLASGESLLKICRDEHLPAESTVRHWADEDRDGFFAKYTHARRFQALHWAEEILTIGDEASKEDYQGARLRVDTRKWLLSKVLPKVYGDKVTLSGDSEAPLEVFVTRRIVNADAKD